MHFHSHTLSIVFLILLAHTAVSFGVPIYAEPALSEGPAPEGDFVYKVNNLASEPSSSLTYSYTAADDDFDWALTPHTHHHDLHGASHSVNEAIRAKGYIEMIRFYARLILNADEADLEDAETHD
ncbi:hypothetical protein BV25DRAFT_1920567 [Artomyces pyxidatus]|uniref:Uncharacterized protein n=1 Tax=Artomyces pyxidatus TaxID=48021 RepID=A0ACB8SKE4_9AGAM|nr:hypothetical protein BV25DRAFT_1920567 [Artomyces pyxidatus]